jgi:hypothetical protein
MAGKPSIRKTSVGGMVGFVLENEAIRTLVVPEFGGRILSLIYKHTETEFAWHSPNVPIRKPSREIEFEDVSGFFDCIPTCEACTFRGRQLPSAGEVAFEPWTTVKVERSEKYVTLKMEITCKVYPFRVRKQISLNDKESILRLKYAIRNLSDQRLEYHYSGHNTMSMTPYHRFVLPREVSKVRLGMAITDRLGKNGDEISWPETVDKEGKTVDISHMGSPCAGFGENLYTARLGETWAAAINEGRKEAIGFSWSGEALPYLLVWISNGGWRGYYHAALEPLTGRPDNLRMAVNEWREYSTIEPRGKVVWRESIIMAHDIEHIEKIEGDIIVQK